VPQPTCMPVTFQLTNARGTPDTDPRLDSLLVNWRANGRFPLTMLGRKRLVSESLYSFDRVVEPHTIEMAASAPPRRISPGFGTHSITRALV
jgi:hypothetical protein